jgi:hypothetical protein
MNINCENSFLILKMLYWLPHDRLLVNSFSNFVSLYFKYMSLEYQHLETYFFNNHKQVFKNNNDYNRLILKTNILFAQCSDTNVIYHVLLK